MYHEDVDLSLRLRLAGGAARRRAGGGRRPRLRVRQGPGEVAAAGAQPLGDDRAHLPGAAARRCSRPALLATELALLAVAAAGGWLPQKLRGRGETLRALPRLLRERRAIQAARTISAAEFAAWLTPDLDSPFLGRAGAFGVAALGAARLLAARAGAAAPP